MSDIATAPRDAYRRSPSRRLGFLAAALAIAALPMVLTGNYWQTNLTICCSRSASTSSSAMRASSISGSRRFTGSAPMSRRC